MWKTEHDACNRYYCILLLPQACSNCNVAEMLLNASKRNWFGVAMNSSATGGWSVKYFEWLLWQDTALYKNLPFSVEGGIMTGHSVV